MGFAEVTLFSSCPTIAIINGTTGRQYATLSAALFANGQETRNRKPMVVMNRIFPREKGSLRSFSTLSEMAKKTSSTRGKARKRPEIGENAETSNMKGMKSTAANAYTCPLRKCSALLLRARSARAMEKSTVATASAVWLLDR